MVETSLEAPASVPPAELNSGTLTLTLIFRLTLLLPVYSQLLRLLTNGMI